MSGLMVLMMLRINEAKFQKTVVYYTDGHNKWNGYMMVVFST